jgi:release factor glutamine methyltransferase
MRSLTPYEINLLIRFGFDPVRTAELMDSSIPVEYFIGKAEFRGKFFNVNNSTLIPRVETEKIIDLALEHVDEKSNFMSYADVGTGSGAIGITFALELLKRDIGFEGYLSDISDQTLEVTKVNLKLIKHYNAKIENIKLINSDLLLNYPKDKKFDIIFANLPYIPTSRIETLDNSVKNYEPIIALDGGKDGLEYIRKLLNQASSYLEPNGTIYLEVDDTHDQSKIREFSKDWNIDVLEDLNKKIRFWISYSFNPPSSPSLQYEIPFIPYSAARSFLICIDF